jgi:hypothetical protein
LSLGDPRIGPPTNEPSFHIIRKLGFRQIGHQIDEIDGLELVFELKR